KDKDAPAHFELYKWAKTQRLYDYADQELSATLRADPNHSEARKIAFAPSKLSKPAPEAAPVKEVADASPVIAVRQMTAVQREANAYDEKIIGYCRALMATFTSDENSRKAALDALNKERLKAGAVMLAYADAGKGGDEETRLASLAGIEATKPGGTEVSNRLVKTALTDPSQAVRKQTAKVIKTLNDE